MKRKILLAFAVISIIVVAAGVCDGHTRFVITHFSHNCNPLTSNLAALEREYGVIAAYDGLELEV